jgi:hypothetical protein
VIVPPIVNVVAPPPPPPPPPVPFTPLHAAITTASKAIRRNDNFLLGIIGVLFFSFFIFRNLDLSRDLFALKGSRSLYPPVLWLFTRNIPPRVREPHFCWVNFFEREYPPRYRSTKTCMFSLPMGLWEGNTAQGRVC